jgi:hypothetical protein
LRRRLEGALQQNVTVLLTPFAAFLLAERVEASGVLAVVVAGLIISQAAPRIGAADARLQTQAFWTLATFLLNAALFVLVGLEVPAAVRGLSSAGLTQALVMVAAVVLVLMGVRLGFLIVSAYTIRLVDRRPEQRLRRVSNRARVVSTFAGFRGAVSLAAALAVPQVTASGQPIPGRDVIVFVTAGVVAATIVLQGLSLPGIVRWARLPADASDREHRFAQARAAEEALAALPEIAAELAARTTSSSACAPSTRTTGWLSAPAVPARTTTTPPLGTSASTARCGWPCLPANATPSSATSDVSTTRSCWTFRPTSTPKRSGSTAVRPPADRDLEEIVPPEPQVRSQDLVPMLAAWSKQPAARWAPGANR